MDELEFYDRQQDYLEELCEIELNFNNVQQLIKIYMATNNVEKKRELAEKIKTIKTDGEADEKQAITLLSQANDHREVLSRSREWVKKHPNDTEAIRYVINTCIELKQIEEAYNFSLELDERIKDQLLLELSSLSKEMFRFEEAYELCMRYVEIYKDNVGGVNNLAHRLVTSACYDGTLKGADYIYWMLRAWEGTKPQRPLNTGFEIDTGFFRRIRVGIMSYDFRAHSVGKFIMSLFDGISNNTGIETYCYYTYPDHEDDYTKVIKEKADVFKYVGRYSDKQLSKVLLEDKLDILVDLNGQTAGTKIALLTERFAPMQVTWMGFPFSSFYYNIDYIIGDYYFDPEDGVTGDYCTEKILRMEPSYMCFAGSADYIITKEPPQVRNGYITLGMFNSTHKFSAEAIALWQKCLEAIPNSRLFISRSSYPGEFYDKLLLERFEKYGLDTGRVDLDTNTDSTRGYFGRYNLVDVMLDSIPFGGGTTTPESLWMGVPVIGCPYHMRHSRMAYAFMHHAGLGSLCADSMEAYPQKVFEVASNLPLLTDLRQNLRGRLKSTDLFNTSVFRTAFENAMRDCYIDYCVKNKRPFTKDAYNDDYTLLKDCVRAADIVLYEFKRERGGSERRAEVLFNEYIEIHRLLTERLAEVYKDDFDYLLLTAKATRMLETLGGISDFEVAFGIINEVRRILTILGGKFYGREQFCRQAE
jgi:predicted O-linked N-acetylglucosamine transferase (SPINDLY family)